MEWEINLKGHQALLRGNDYEDLRTLCRDAYAEGRAREKEKALEAYRLRCENLFGNRCMSPYPPTGIRNMTCNGECLYMKRFRWELGKLED